MDDPDHQLFSVFPVAAGLLVFGVLSVLAGRTGSAWRLAAGWLTVGVGYALLTAAYEGTAFAAHAAVALAATAVAVVATRLAPLARGLRTPLGYGTAAIAAGVAGLIGSFLYYEQAVAFAHEHETAALHLLSFAPERVEAQDAHLVTDQGHPIAVYRAIDPRAKTESDKLAHETMATLNRAGTTIQRHPADENSNCHGWVFTGGRYIVPGSAVERILQDNGYAAVPAAAPGDLVVYRNAAGEVAHTAVVRYVAPGLPPMVEGKWGWLGVYLHAADESGYGKAFTFYRSHRDGDLLKGLPGASGLGFTGAE